MTSRKREPERNSANAEGFADAIYENPPANLADLPLDTVEQYIAGYEEGRAETMEKWIIVNDKSK
jgi:hypothetical protein